MGARVCPPLLFLNAFQFCCRRKRPDDFSYQLDSQQTSTFVVAELWKDETILLQNLRTQLTYPTSRMFILCVRYDSHSK